MAPSTIKLLPCLVDANTQTAKCSFNVKFKTANDIPLCHSSPYHAFIFQLHFGSNPLPVCTGVLSVALSATTLTDSKQRALAGSRLQASTSHITNGRYVIHLRKSGLMSLQNSQQLQKIMLLLRITCGEKKVTAKNNAWSQLSVVVSMMGMLHPPLPTSMRFLSISARCTCRKLFRAVSGIRPAALPLWQACHLFSYHTFSNLSCPEKADYYTQDKDSNRPN